MFSILILTPHNVSGKLKNRGNSSETISYLSFLFIVGRSIFPAHNQGVWIHTLSNDRDDYKGGKRSKYLFDKHHTWLKVQANLPIMHHVHCGAFVSFA